jgi:hypothetical protein
MDREQPRSTSSLAEDDADGWARTDAIVEEIRAELRRMFEILMEMYVKLALTNPTVFFFGLDRRIHAISSISRTGARRPSA